MPPGRAKPPLKGNTAPLTGNADKSARPAMYDIMPGTTRVEIRTLKVGRYVALEENAYKILGMSKSKPGKHGSAKARIELEDIFTGQKRSLSLIHI